MAKREFIEKEKVKKSLDEGWYRGIYPRNTIMCLHTFTEQDIVKPYLDKLKEQIKSQIIDSPTVGGTNVEMACYNGGLLKSLELIDNLLSEQGGQKCLMDLEQN